MLVSANDDIAFFQANLRRRSARFHVAHHDAFVLAFVAHFRTFNTVEDRAGINLILVALLQLNGHRHRLTVSQQAKLDFAADRHGTHLGTQSGEAADRFTVQRGNHIAGFNARLSGGRVWHDLADERAALRINFHRFRQLGIQLGTHDT